MSDPGFIAVNRKPSELAGATIQFDRAGGSGDTGTFDFDTEISGLSLLSASAVGVLGAIQSWFGDPARDWYPNGAIQIDLVYDDASPYLGVSLSFSHSGSPQNYTLTVSSAFQTLFGLSASEGPASTIAADDMDGTAVCTTILSGKRRVTLAGSASSVSRSGGWTLSRPALSTPQPARIESICSETQMAALDAALRSGGVPRLAHFYESKTGEYPLLSLGQLNQRRQGEFYRVTFDGFWVG